MNEKGMQVIDVSKEGLGEAPEEKDKHSEGSSELRDPEEYSKEQIEAAQSMISGKKEAETQAKEDAIDSYSQAHSALTEFRDARKFIMEKGNSEGISKQQMQLQKEIERSDKKIALLQQNIKNAFPWSYKYKTKVKEDMGDIEAEKKKLIDAIAELNELKLLAKQHESKFYGKREDFLMADVAKAKMEAEKH